MLWGFGQGFEEYFLEMERGIIGDACEGFERDIAGEVLIDIVQNFQNDGLILRFYRAVRVGHGWKLCRK